MSEVETLHLSDKASTDRFMFKQSFGPLLSPPERACISTAGNTEKLRKMAVHARIFHSNSSLWPLCRNELYRLNETGEIGEQLATFWGWQEGGGQGSTEFRDVDCKICASSK